MNKHNCDLAGRLEISGETCTIYPEGRASPIVARVLGVRVVGNSRMIYLDRKIHAAHQDAVCGLQASGAIATVLTGAAE